MQTLYTAIATSTGGRDGRAISSDNILDVQVEPGDSVEVTVDDELEDCMYDFAYSFDDGSAYVERVDMCEINGETYEFTGG